MLFVTRQMDYGLLLMEALARAYGHGFVSLRQIAVERRMPYRFLVKIVLPLRRAGLLAAQEGAHGGYALAKSPVEITIREVLEALLPAGQAGSEPLSLVRCETSSHSCQSFCQCGSRSFWHELQSQIDKVLDCTTVADLVKSSVPSAKPNVTFRRLIAHAS